MTSNTSGNSVARAYKGQIVVDLSGKESKNETKTIESKTWLCIYFSFIFFFVGVTVKVSVERLRWLECFDQKCKYYFSK